MLWISFVYCKQKAADGRRISDWSSDVCSSDLCGERFDMQHGGPGRLNVCEAWCFVRPGAPAIADCGGAYADERGTSRFGPRRGIVVAMWCSPTWREYMADLCATPDRKSTRLKSSH